MTNPQDDYDDAMAAYSRSEYQEAVDRLRAILAELPDHFEARLALGMSLYRQGNYPEAIVEGHKAEALRPKDQLVHTNLSLMYMKAGNKVTAEHHGLQARIASWREEAAAGGPAAVQTADPELQMAKPKPVAPKKFPEMPWKKKPEPPAANV